MERAQQILRDIFGYNCFRHQQAEIISDLIAGRDVLALMPTGGGKSLCYQIPALIRPGVAVVISPLIALMKDQVDALCQLGLRAAAMNATLDAQSLRQTEHAILQGRLDLLYIAPERLLNGRMVDLLQRTQVALFAIDEAHCVSQWGHDFRREYQQLGCLKTAFPGVPRIALTATADQRTRDEIIAQLSLQDAGVYINSFDRPNIRYHITTEQKGREALLAFIDRFHPRDAGIVYCLSRRKVEAIAEWLFKQGRQALPYHAGLSDAVRQQNQERFLREDGLIIVATVAFGMGINKPDVRFVAHLNLPKSIEAYYQETGRAGRDDAPASAWMNYQLQDIIMLRQMLSSGEGAEAFKRLSHHKLETMLGLCETIGCRRSLVLSYFGEHLDGPCGNCDNCLNEVKTWDGTESAQKALSCVFRSGQRFGVNYLVAILRGESDDRIPVNGHDRISTYAIGQDLGANEWRSIFRQLIARGYLDVDLEGHGALRLTEQCRALLRGDERIALRVLQKPAPRKRTARAVLDELSTADHGLLKALRTLRTDLARDQGVPPYVIFHDATLRDVASRLPETQNELGAIHGIGKQKLEKYGHLILEVVRTRSLLEAE